MQLYECKADWQKAQSGAGALTWQFREPIATLMMDGKSVGTALRRSELGAHRRQRSDGQGDRQHAGRNLERYPWLSLDVVGHRGNGILSDVTTVQRINTRGGVAKGSCERQAVTSVSRIPRITCFCAGACDAVNRARSGELKPDAKSVSVREAGSSGRRLIECRHLDGLANYSWGSSRPSQMFAEPFGPCLRGRGLK